MSIVVFVAVHKCDGCGCYIALANESEEASFAETWYAGFAKDFCPECRDTAAVQKALIADEDLAHTFVETVSRSAAAKEVEYAN